MADSIRHARSVSPYFIPNTGGSADDFHGLINLAGGASVDSEDLFVIGKKEKCGTDTDTPESSVPLTQRERGQIQTYLTLANLSAEPSGGIDLEDFSSSLVDVAFYEREEFDGTIVRTVWFPKTAVASIGLNIADPESPIERTFELTGDDKLELEGANDTLIWVQNTAPSGTSGNYVIDVSDPEPAEDPRTSGQFILRIDRTRSGETTTLTLTTDYTFNSTSDEITILSALTGDVYNIYYASAGFGGLGDPTTVDPCSDPAFLKAENVTVLLSDGTTEVELDKLTSLTIDATLNRLDELVIGNDERILREIDDTPVTVSLTGRIDDSTIAKAFMNQLGETNVITSVKEFLSNVRVTVKIYDDADKSTFLIGYQVDNLSFTDDTLDYTSNDFGSLDVSAESDNLKVTTTEGDLT